MAGIKAPGWKRCRFAMRDNVQQYSVPNRVSAVRIPVHAVVHYAQPAEVAAHMLPDLIACGHRRCESNICPYGAMQRLGKYTVLAQLSLQCCPIALPSPSARQVIDDFAPKTGPRLQRNSAGRGGFHRPEEPMGSGRGREG